MKKLNEFELIEKYFAPLAGEGSFDLKDDAALLTSSPGHEFVITQDAIAEGTHFFGDDPPDLIAKKALRVNLSDLIAKGAEPKAISLALGLGAACDEKWVSKFASGLVEDLKYFRIGLSGGDTFKSGSGTVISITAIGEVPEGKYVSRLGADIGDAIFVTGTIGDAALGLLERMRKLSPLSKFHSFFLEERYLLPQPRVECAGLVREFASASMDISDGLVGDLEKLCSASGVGAEVLAEQVPLSDSAQEVIKHESKYLKTALTGGDDYEILLTVPQTRVTNFIEHAQVNEYGITRIGKIISGEGVKVFDNSGEAMEFEQTSYVHSGE